MTLYLFLFTLLHVTSFPGFLCDECGKGFLCAENLRHHKRTHNKKQMKCPHCDTISLGLPAHKRHLLRHQQIKFICTICGLQLSNTAKLAIHKSIRQTSVRNTLICVLTMCLIYLQKYTREPNKTEYTVVRCAIRNSLHQNVHVPIFSRPITRIVCSFWNFQVNFDSSN